ncbi:aminoacyl-histidine dipeptidase [bacterium]|nr:aminoacyl-histidine dipeptidase [bacterium]
MADKTEKILEIFRQINAVPRKSKNEEKIAAWLIKWGKDNGFVVEQDEIKNVLIRVPATVGYEERETVILQGHMDMVCEKAKGVTHDFSKDPIKHIFDGDWLTADGTTLGADNGIALAIALVLVTDETVKHPPLELLFTVDEETGLTGASELRSGWLKGKYLLNLDSEDEHVFTIGCAGGKDTHIRFTGTRIPVADKISYRVTVGGLKGGHSGVDITEPLANANVVLSRLLESCELNIVSIEGGSAHNAIPRDATAFVRVADGAQLKKRATELQKVIQKEYAGGDEGITITVEMCQPPVTMFDRDSTFKLVHLLRALPHGIAAMSRELDGLVETSNNLAVVTMPDDNTVEILTSQRSSVMSKLDDLTDRIEAVGKLANAEVISGNGYPSWEPDMDSGLLKVCVSEWKNVTDVEPVVEVIHAGLECGIIGSKYDGMEMISYGPTIKNPHSPDEKLFVPSIKSVYDFTASLLEKLGD